MSDFAVSWRIERLPPAPTVAASAPGAALGFAEAVLAVVISIFLTAAPVVAHTLHPAAGVTLALLLGGVCAWRMPQVSVIAVIFALLFQNLFVSIMADHVVSEDDFDIIRGYNFMLLSVSWLVVVGSFLADWRSRNRAIDPFVKFSTIVFVLIGLYFLVGFALYGMTAIVYLRNIVTPLLLFHLCLIIFMRSEVRPGLALTMVTVLFVLCGMVEVFDRLDWLELTNGYAYWELAMGPNYVTMAFDKMAEETGHISTGLLDGFSIMLFNSPLLADFEIEIMRLFGPNMHAISFAYALSFMAVFSLYRGRFVLAALLLVLLVLTSAKGPLILFLMVGISWTMSRIFGMRFAFFCHGLMLIVYTVVGIVVGLSIGDYHVIGLMGGLSEFLVNPIGRGIGAGGNLSSEFAKIDWPAAQEAGRTPFAVESSVGVLLYQMGVFAAAVIGIYTWISWRLLLIAERTGNNLHAATSFALMTMVASGLFQEEAYFSPLALGLFMALAGMIVGASLRTRLLR